MIQERHELPMKLFTIVFSADELHTIQNYLHERFVQVHAEFEAAKAKHEGMDPRVIDKYFKFKRLNEDFGRLLEDADF